METITNFLLEYPYLVAVLVILAIFALFLWAMVRRKSRKQTKQTNGGPTTTQSTDEGWWSVKILRITLLVVGAVVLALVAWRFWPSEIPSGRAPSHPKAPATAQNLTEDTGTTPGSKEAAPITKKNMKDFFGF